MMERPSRTLKVKRVRNNMYSSERCAQANNEKKYTDFDDGDSINFTHLGSD